MKLPSGRWTGAVSFTLALILLVALATVEVLSYMLIVNLVAIALAVAFFFFVFPGSRFFSVAFANDLAVYMCIFVFFKESNFAPLHGPVVAIGFLMPIAAFVVGAWLRREPIRSIVTSEHLRDERHIGRIFVWLLPVFAVGTATFFLPDLGLGALAYQAAFIVAMGLIALVVFTVSADVCTFLLDSGLIFEEFFVRIQRLVVPAFGFFTFYSLLVIVFAAIYRVFDRYSDTAHFVIDGQVRVITFSESLYFSVVSMSTVGYGDILPASDSIRVIVAAQIMAGVLLLLFGVTEILRYAREREALGGGR